MVEFLGVVEVSATLQELPVQPRPPVCQPAAWGGESSKVRLRGINKETKLMQNGLCSKVPFTLTFNKVYLKLEIFPLCSLQFKGKL